MSKTSESVKKHIADLTIKDKSLQSDPRPDHAKAVNVLANISHKNTFGANNWLKFLELQPPKSPKKTKSRCNKITEKNSLGKSHSKHNFTKSCWKDNNTMTDSEKKNSSTFNGKTNSNVHLRDKLRPTHKPRSPTKTDQLNLQRFSMLSKGELVAPGPIKGSLHTEFTKKFGFDKVHGIKCKKSDGSHIIANKFKLTKQIAMDCEMVGVEVGIDNSIVARVSLVNAEGDCIYDTFVKPSEPVLDYRTEVSGVRPEDIENAPDFETVQRQVADMIKGRILVGHALKHDLQVLLLTHPRHLIRDTSKFKKFRVGSTPALKKLAKMYLGVTIQDGEHSSVQDALAAMQLYRMFRKEWEASLNYKAKKHGSVGVNSKKSQGIQDFISSVDT